MQKKKRLRKRFVSFIWRSKKPENIEKKAINTQKALIGELAKNKYQPRTVFDESKRNELSQSIKKNGIIQPIAVRKNKSSTEPYEIVAGERRWLAFEEIFSFVSIFIEERTEEEIIVSDLDISSNIKHLIPKVEEVNNYLHRVSYLIGYISIQK